MASTHRQLQNLTTGAVFTAPLLLLRYLMFKVNPNLKAAPERHEAAPPDDNPLRQCHPQFLREIGLDVDPVEWVYGGSLIRGMLSIFGGIGGVGKTSRVMKVLLSIAIGRSLLALDRDEPAHTIYEPKAKVWYYSLEDPLDMLQRKVKAELIHHNINPRMVWDNIALRSGRDAPLIVAKVNETGIVRCDIQPIVDFIIEHGIVVMGVDPFANSFEGPGAEDKADYQKIVLDQWRIIAHKANCAIWLIHHFKKGGLAGDADAFRGSSAMQNAARVMETMATMTQDEADLLGIHKNERRQYVRLDNAKVNLSAAPTDCEWYRFVGVPLGNRTEKYPKGDIVGVLTRWKPTITLLTLTQARRFFDVIDQGEPLHNDPSKKFYFTNAPQGAYWAGTVLMNLAQFTRERAIQQIKDWISSGVLTEDKYRHPEHGKPVKCVRVNRRMATIYLEQLGE